VAQITRIQPGEQAGRPLTVAWIPDYPVEWLDPLPEALRPLVRKNPGTWAMVLLGELQQLPGLKVHVIVLRRGVAQDVSFERQGVTFHVLKASPRWRAASLYWLDTWLIRRLLRRLRPDLVHAWGVEYGGGMTASRLPYPYVLTMQGLFQWYSQITPLPGAYWKLVKFLEPISLGRARIVTTESKFAVDYLHRRYPHLQIHQAEHASNWVFHRVERHPRTRPVRFVCVAQMSHRKGIDLLFQGLDQLRAECDFELVCITGSDHQMLQALKPTVSQDLWRRVRLETDLLPPRVALELAEATLFLLPTRADTSPNAVKEAAVAGLPVVASAVGGIPDYILPGKNGLLCQPGELASFVEAVRAALRHPLFSRGQVDAATLAWVRDYLSPRTMARNFLGAYQAALRDTFPSLRPSESHPCFSQ
jgi:glycosyltransferase involved in cell wall biosynthesis